MNSEDTKSNKLDKLRQAERNPKQVLTKSRFGKHEISSVDAASLHVRLATQRLNEVWMWMVDIKELCHSCLNIDDCSQLVTLRSSLLQK